MAPKVVREDLVVPYRHIPSKPRVQSTGVIAQSLPMAALFMRNKMLSWSSMFIALQNFLNSPVNKPESEDQEQPPLLGVVFSLIAVLSCYLGLFFPNADPTLRAIAKNSVETAAA